MTKLKPRPPALQLNLGQTQLVFNKLISQVFLESVSAFDGFFSRVAVSPISNSVQLMLLTGMYLFL
jgi:hypothetical protein